MMKVFIDGSAGTTGLQIHQRLAQRADLEIITLTGDQRKDLNARKTAVEQADVAFLCLPDDAARELVAAVGDCGTRIIDTSTAHRVDPDWVYGLPELPGQLEKIRGSKRIANPGCHATGFITLVAPLVAAGIIPGDLGLTCFSLTGYSGGGTKMIAQYEAETPDPLYKAPRQYGITQKHKHLPEMAAVCGLETDPIFCPIVADFFSGMEVTVPLFAKDIRGTAEDIKAVYSKLYTGPVVKYRENADEGGFLSACALQGRDDLEVTVSGSGERILLVARFDNLGKGACGAAIQNMNILLGLDPTAGLKVD